MSRWATRRLRDVCIGVYDGPHATPLKASDGPVFLGISNLNNGRLDLSEVEHIAESHWEKWTRRVTPQPGDVVFSYETRLGQAAIIPDGLRCCLGRRLGLLRPDPSEIDPRFLLYTYLSPAFQDFLATRTLHGSTVDRLPVAEYPDFEIPVPELRVQQGIVGVLGALDDKIELNRRMNRTLEELALALFKSWFVDFDPVLTKRDGRKLVGVPVGAIALFPNQFEYAGDERVPKGWRAKRIGDLVAGIFDGPHATPPPAISGGVFLGIRNLPGTRIDLSEVRYISESDWARWTRRVLPVGGDIVFTYEATIGRFAVVPPNLRCCLGRRVALIRPKRRDDTDFLFLSFISDAFQELLLARSNTGSTVERIPLEDFPSYEILWPGQQLVDLFASLVAPLRTKVNFNEEEGRQLVALRDALLGPLLSGEITLKQAGKAIAEVA